MPRNQLIEPNEMSWVFTAQEAADFLKVSKSTIVRLASSGKVPGFKVGSQWRFSKETILELCNGLR